MKRKILILLAAVAVLFCGPRPANADSITYTVSSTATGTIGEASFTDALVTITFVGDTSNVTSPFTGLFVNSVEEVAATGTIGGIGTFTFSDSLAAFVNQFGTYGPTAGIDDLSFNDILDTFDTTSGSEFGSYDLTTAIGPITDASIFNPGTSYGTCDGDLTFTDMSANSTFTATTSVPEPSSLLLLGVALAGLVTLRRGRLL